MHPLALAYGALGLSIAAEIAGTTFLMKSEQFSRLAPTVACALFYVVSFYFLSHALKTLPLGLAYAIWGGLGIVVTGLIGLFVFRQVPDLAAIVGIGLILAGVIVVNAFSRTVAH
ncbi:DMT family transporter [Methylobrevis albus]|uniref:Multidrug efflux SMR transporter n=1 Tax=Methylobrevis albus TaxID=2793297 RepID=A0A931N044_9HYPH|nr:multidrug efflux SMR transporter [Methylobrevis albus]MBH0240037.1 multidrug efflux SMR transporter [Methylobrevis albus]